MKVFSIIISVLTLLAALAGKVSPETSSIMSVLALAVPFLLVLCLIISIYWAIRLRFWIWFTVIAMLANWGYMSSVIQLSFGKKAIPEGVETLKIATYNVGRFGNDNSGLNARRISFGMYEEQVDVICFQEFNAYKELPYDSLNTIFSVWPYASIPTPEDGMEILPLAIYSSYPIVNSGLISFPSTKNSSMWADILVNDKTIRVFNNHLQTTNINQSRGDLETGFYLYSNNDIIRARQAETVSAYIKKSPHPVLVAGDLNSLPSSYTYHTMKGNLKDGFRTGGHGYAYTYRYFKRLLRIDYIFHSPSFNAIDYYSPDWDFGSDHNPVMLEVSMI